MSEEVENPIVLFGETNFRNQDVRFGIKMDDRRRHMYIIGKTGMGKSELLKNIAIQDIQDGRGLAFIDPHGDPVEDLLDYIPEHRIKDVIYINPSDLEHPIAFNVMESVDPDKRHLVADGIMAVFKKLWADLWSARMEYILNYTILALLEVPGTTLLGINRMLAEKGYRKWVVDQVTDPEVKAFWTKEFAGYTERYTSEAVPAIQNKIGQFVANSLIRNIVGQPKSSFDIREAMDQQKILLINISKGRVGEDASRLLGGLLITKIQLAAMSRVDIPRNERKDFVLIVDEFQNFATASFANILSEARKFNLSLVIAHQYVAQMDEEVRDAVFGNVGTIVAFRVGAEDAELLEKEFAPEFLVQDIVDLGKRQIYLKLMIDGVASHAFSAMTMDTIRVPAESTRPSVIEASRMAFGHPRAHVEQAILEWRQKEFEEPKAESRGRNEYRGGNADRRRDQRPSMPPQRPSEGVHSTQAQRPSEERGSTKHSNTHVAAGTRTEISLSEALTHGAVNFKGRKLDTKEKKEDRPKAEVNSEELRRLLDEALKK
jgi:hypothetical protein